MSLQGEQCCGAVISFGFGGVLTEDWARELKQSLLLWPVSAYSPQEALEEAYRHLGLLSNLSAAREAFGAVRVEHR